MNSPDKPLSDVQLLARRMALMYHFFAQVLLEELGEEKAECLLKKAIWKYGEYCGKCVRDEVEKRGELLSEANFSSVPDLPASGWETSKSDGSNLKITYCPLADVWQEMKTPLARLYCFVDQAKYQGYNPDLTCSHAKNVLDGDPFCEIVVRCKNHGF